LSFVLLVVARAKEKAMQNLEFGGLLAVAAVAFLLPLLLGLFVRLRIPASVLQVAAGIVIGPAVLGWVQPDVAVRVFSLVGLAFLLFFGGLEIEFEHLQGRPLRVTLFAFLVSFGLAFGVATLLTEINLIASSLLVAIILAATGLGIIIPILEDSEKIGTPFGQIVIAGASIADLGTVVLLSLFFSREASGVGAQVALIALLALLAVVIVLVIARASRSSRLDGVLAHAQDSSAQLRVRGAYLLLIVFAFAAQRLGLEIILGAFVAGVVFKAVDHGQAAMHPNLKRKLEAVGYGVFVPAFFVTSGLQFDLGALLTQPSALLQVPLFLLALLLVRGLPALLYRPLLNGMREVVAAGFFQATSLGFIVIGAQLGIELKLLEPATGAALIAAGMLSLLLFPFLALLILGNDHPKDSSTPEVKLEVKSRVPQEEIRGTTV
jgi:Kef-type K+ transport system membrane component KefB